MLTTNAAQSINNQFFGLLGRTGNDLNSSEDNDSFSKLLDQMTGMNANNSSVRASVSVRTTVTLANKTVDAKADLSKSNSVANDNKLATDANSKAKINSSETGNQPTAETKVDSEKTDVVSEEAVEVADTSDITEEDIEKIASIFVQIEIVIVQTLNISVDELETSMNQLGMNLTDLVDESKLRDLFAFIKSDGDLMNMLNDNNLLELCDEMMGQITDLLSENGFDFETIQTTIETMKLAPTEENFEIFTGISKEVNVVITSDGSKDYVAKKDYSREESEEKEVTIDFREAAKTSEIDEASGQHSGTGAKNENSAKNTNAELADNFMNNLLSVVAEKADFAQSINEVTQIREIANQILDQIKVNVTPDTKSLEIVLTPENLGKVNVTLSENNGVITAKFTTETHIAREAIEANMQQFKDNLQAKGVTVSEIEVTVSDFSFNRNHEQDAEQNQSQGKNKRHFSIDEINERLDGVPDLTSQTLIDDGLSTVSYRA